MLSNYLLKYLKIRNHALVQRETQEVAGANMWNQYILSPLPTAPPPPVVLLPLVRQGSRMPFYKQKNQNSDSICHLP